MVTVDGFPVPVDVAGPDKGSVVVVLGAAHHAPAAYDAVCQRLHTASLRTIVVGPDPAADRQVGGRHPRRARGEMGAAGRRPHRRRTGMGVGRDPVGPVHRAGGDRPRSSARRRPHRGDPRRTLPAGGDEHHRAGQHTCRAGRSPRPASATCTATSGLSTCSAGATHRESTAQLAAEIVLRTSNW